MGDSDSLVFGKRSMYVFHPDTCWLAAAAGFQEKIFVYPPYDFLKGHSVYLIFRHIPLLRGPVICYKTEYIINNSRVK